MPPKRSAPEAAGTSSNINDLRVVDLRTALAKLGLPTNGNKADLVQRLSEATNTTASNKKNKPEPAPTAEKVHAGDSDAIEAVVPAAPEDVLLNLPEPSLLAEPTGDGKTRSEDMAEPMAPAEITKFVAESDTHATASTTSKPSGPNPVLAGVRCLLTGFGASSLRETIELHGGTVVDAVRKTLPLTHLVVGESGINEYGQKTGKGSKKYKEALKLRPKPVEVDPQFIRDTIAKDIPVFPEAYAEVTASLAEEAATATPEDRLEALHSANTKKDIRTAVDEVVALIDRCQLADDTLVLFIKAGLEYPLHRVPMRREAGNLIKASIQHQLARADEQQFRRLVPLWAKAGRLLVQEGIFADAIARVVGEVTHINAALAVPLLLNADISCSVIIQNARPLSASTDVIRRLLTGLKDAAGMVWHQCVWTILEHCSLEPDFYRVVAEEALERFKKDPSALHARFPMMRHNIASVLACTGLQAESEEAKDIIRTEIRAKFKEYVESAEIRRNLIQTDAKLVLDMFPKDFFVEERRVEAARAEEEAKQRADYQALVEKHRETLKLPEIKLVKHWAKATGAMTEFIHETAAHGCKIYHATSQYSVTVAELGGKLYTIVMERYEDTPTGGVWVRDPREKPQDRKWFCAIIDGFRWQDSGNDAKQDAYGGFVTNCLETWWYEQRDKHLFKGE